MTNDNNIVINHLAFVIDNMKISLNWLKQYVDIPKDLSPMELALKLTMSTVEVEEVIDLGSKLNDLYVGQVIKIIKHPDADKLFVAEVDIKKKKLQLVYGQRAEVEEGNLVPVVVAPSVLPTGIKVEKRKIRGVQSEGMLCLDSEFIPAGEDVLTYFPKETKVGSLVKEVMGLDDIIFVIDNKSITHRSDLWGHYGIAREIAAILGVKLKELEVAKIKEEPAVDLKISIEDKENCSRYIGVAVGNIKIEPSPLWLQNLLKSCDIRPINNIVDITNFVTLELGRPSHAFDRREVRGDTIIVRRATPGEKFITLDGKEREMTDEMCLVGDAERPIDLAGIMGGENSQIKNDTTEIILELANFNPVNIRRTAIKLDLRTEAATRFEKGLDPSLAELGLKRVLTLIKELIPGARIISQVVDVNYEKEDKREIELDLDFLKRRIGQEIPKKEVMKIFKSLSFNVVEQKNKLLINPPSFRTAKDISTPEDLVEEVARIYGYDNIRPLLPYISLAPPEVNLELDLEEKIKIILCHICGLNEVYNYSFTSDKYLVPLGINLEDQLQLKNYISSEQKYLRSSLLSNLIKNIIDNLRFYKNFDLFELGRVFINQPGEYKTDARGKEFLPKQEKHLAGISVTLESFYKIKGIVSTLLDRLEVAYEFRLDLALKQPFCQPERYLEIVVSDEPIGFLTELSGSVLKIYDIDKSVSYWEINFHQLLKYVQDKKVYQPLPKFPGIIYDLSLLIPLKITWAKVAEEVLSVSPLIKKVELFDVYQLTKLGPDKRSLAFHLHFIDPKRTLTTKDADILRDKIIKRLVKKFKAEIR